jgi:prepilin-type N-terminal cleavage/methylation domain-containing protein
MRKQKGFSLIELLIVVAIILIIAAIAIPNLLRAKIAANESSAAASVVVRPALRLALLMQFWPQAARVGTGLRQLDRVHFPSKAS